MNAPSPESDAAGSPPDRDDRQRTATAYHEAGHAVMAHSLGRLVQKVTILPGKSPFGRARLGVCELRKERFKAARDLVEEDVLILLAGMVAEARFTGQYCRPSAAEDLRAVRRLLGDRAHSDAQLEKKQRRLIEKTENLLHDDAHIKAIEFIANELLQRTTIRGRAVRHFFQYAEQLASR